MQRRGLLSQFDELGLAVGSPARAAMDHDKRTTSRARPMEIDQHARLVRQRDLREALPERGTDTREIEDGEHGSFHRTLL